MEILEPAERLQHLSIYLAKELDVLELEYSIHDRVQQEVDRSQRELFLREQMRAIQTELGELDTHLAEVGEIGEKIAGSDMPDEVRAKAEKELDRLKTMPPAAPEIGVIRTYLDWLLGTALDRGLRGQPGHRPGRHERWTPITTGCPRPRSASSSTWPCASCPA